MQKSKKHWCNHNGVKNKQLKNITTVKRKEKENVYQIGRIQLRIFLGILRL